MGTVRIVAARRIRQRVWGVVGLAVLVAVAGGAALTAFAGARRTDEAYGRFLRETHAADVIVAAQGFGFVEGDAVARLPHVEQVGVAAGFGLLDRPDPFGAPSGTSAEFSAASVDGRFAFDLEGARVVEGRLPRFGAVHEVGVNQVFSLQSGLGVGDVFRALIVDFPAQQVLGERLGAEQRDATVEELRAVYHPIDLRIVLVAVGPTDLLTDDESGSGVVIMTPAFARRFSDLIGYQIVAVRLDDPRHVASFTRAARRAFPDAGIDFQVPSTGATVFAHETAPYVDALRAFALVAALTALFVIGQALTRTVHTDAEDAETLGALGAVRGQRAAVAGARALVSVWVGSVLAVVVAVLTSPLFPLGRARDAEPTPGVRVDVPVMAVGLAVIVVSGSVLALFVAWRTATTRHTADARGASRSSVADRVARSGAPLVAVTGVRFALGRDRDASATSLTATVTGLLAAIVTLTATLVFAFNLGRLVDTPSAYGWRWDALIDLGDDGVDDALTRQVVADDRLEAVSVGTRANLEVSGRSVGAFSFSSPRGSVVPAITAGRAARGAREIVLGSHVMSELDASIGDVVSAVTTRGDTVDLRVVGRSLFPGLALNEVTAINDSAMVTPAAMRELDPAVRPSFYLVRTQPGIAQRALIGDYGDRATVVTAFRPGEIESYAHVRFTPTLLAGLLALLGIGVLAHMLATSVRAHRRELAVLKTLGFTRRQVAATVAWQSTALVGVPLAVGVPLGLAAGRFFWHRLTGSLGIADAVAVPVFALVALLVATIVLANLIAAFPRAERRAHPSRRRPTIGVTVASRVEPVEPLELTTIRDDLPSLRVWSPTATGAAIVAVLALAGAVVAAAVTGHDDLGPGRVLGPLLVGAWAGAAVFVAVRRPREPLSSLMAVGAATGALALLAAALLSRETAADDVREAAAFARAFSVSLLPALGLHLALGVPDGALRSRARRITVAVGYTCAVVVGVLVYGDRPLIRLGPLVVLTASAIAVGVVAFLARCRSSRTAQDRARLQWIAWGVIVAVAIAVIAIVLHALVDWPGDVVELAVASTVLVPLALALSVSSRMAVRIDRLLVQTITLAGLVVMVGACYLLIVLGLGRSPSGDEQTLLGLSMLAAAVAALLWVPVRERIADAATRRVYGEQHAPDEVLRTFGSRLTRALPLDELLMQLAESLKKTMSLDVAEVWTRGGGRLERTVSVPERGPASIAVGAEEETVVARAGVSGAAWARIWLPSVLRGAGDEILRIAPITNTGELLGMIVVRRDEGALPFTDDDDQVLTELARQVGLALHNVKLDSALQESLDEVRRQADELRASRARIVEAGDAQRRAIERDLHDGAQQHLVALAVNINLTRQLVDGDLETAKSMLEQIGHDLQDAVQELRNLAHGIYPPLLMDRGLHDALTAAAGRAALPTEVVADDVGRYSQAVEAAVYFCCLEALQNAAKHAGAGAVATVTVHEQEGALLFAVADDGAGFDTSSSAAFGHGFVNMSDRVGAIGGSIVVDSAPGAGTTIQGRVPLTEQ